jgi:hypothetical protein
MARSAASGSRGAAWGLALGCSLAAALVGVLGAPFWLSWPLQAALLLVGGWAMVARARISVAHGALAFFAGAWLAAIFTFSRAAAQVVPPSMPAQLDAQMAQGSTALALKLRELAGGMAATFAFLRVFLLGTLGCLVGRSQRR